MTGTCHQELQRNGYEVLKGKRLIDFKLAASASDVPEMDFGNKIPQLGVFDFRAFLNVGMLLGGVTRDRS